jgi:hypothetical protein
VEDRLCRRTILLPPSTFHPPPKKRITIKKTTTIMTKVKKELLKFGIQTVINLLAAVLTALGATSCM